MKFATTTTKKGKKRKIDVFAADLVFVVVVVDVDFIVQLELVGDFFDGHLPDHLHAPASHADRQFGVELGSGLAFDEINSCKRTIKFSSYD